MQMSGLQGLYRLKKHIHFDLIFKVILANQLRLHAQLLPL